MNTPEVTPSRAGDRPLAPALENLSGLFDFKLQRLDAGLL